MTVPGSTLQAADSHQNEVAPEISFESGLGTVTHRTGRRRGPSGRDHSNTGISLLSRSSGFVERIWRRCVSGKAKWASRSGSASASSSATAGKRGRMLSITAAELLPRRALVGLLEDEPDGRGDHAPGAARDEVLGVAGEVHPAALPGRAEELLADRLDQPRMVVADDEPDAREAALDEARMNAGQAEPSSLPGRQLEAQHPPLAAVATPAATSAAIDTTRPPSRTLTYVASSHRYGYAVVAQRPAAERLDLGVEGGADPADLAPADPLDAQGARRGPRPGA